MTEIHLSEQSRAFIDEQIRAGIYRNVDDVVAAGLRLLGSEEGKLVELQRLVQEGLDDIEAGRVHHYASGDDLLADIKRLARERGLNTESGH